MPIFSNIRNSIARSGKNAINMSKAAGSARESERDLRNALRELGEKYDEIYGDSPLEGLSPYVERVRESRKALEEANAALNAARGYLACPECGTKASQGMNFCPACGAKLPEQAAAANESNELFCPYCGKPANPELQFCTYCNKPIYDAGNEPMELNVCPRCHKLAPSGAKTCPECGEELA